MSARTHRPPLPPPPPTLEDTVYIITHLAILLHERTPIGSICRYSSPAIPPPFIAPPSTSRSSLIVFSFQTAYSNPTQATNTATNQHEDRQRSNSLLKALTLPQLEPKTTKHPTKQTLHPSVSRLFFLCGIQFAFLTCSSSTALLSLQHSGSPTLQQFSCQQNYALYSPNNTVGSLFFPHEFREGKAQTALCLARFYDGRTESHEQHFFFACELGIADKGECGGRRNRLLCYP